jgi:hypothetical protein
MVSASMHIPECRTSFSFFISKSIIERTIHYMKDRTDCFDGYFPCKKDNDFRLKRVMNCWVCLSLCMIGQTMEKIAKWTEPNCNNIKLLMRM